VCQLENIDIYEPQEGTKNGTIDHTALGGNFKAKGGSRGKNLFFPQGGRCNHNRAEGKGGVVVEREGRKTLSRHLFRVLGGLGAHLKRTGSPFVYSAERSPASL